MIGLDNKFDSSFFYVSMPLDFPVESVTGGLMRDITSKVISFSVEEESTKIISGSIQFLDNDWKLTTAFRPGRLIEISWGYKNPDVSGMSIYNSLVKNLNALKGLSYRRGIKAYIQKVSGSAGENGVRLFTMQFMGNEYLSAGKMKTWSAGTRYTVVKDVLTSLGCVVTYIGFKTMNQPVTPLTMKVQVKPPFAYLAELSFEWRAVFKIGYNDKGLLIGCFADYNTIALDEFAKDQGQALSGSYVAVNYQSPDSGIPNNIRSFSWNCNMSGGDSVNIMTGADGKPQFMRFMAGTETAQVWVLNDDELKKQVDDGLRKDVVEAAAFIIKEMSATKFSEVQKYFKLAPVSTAPQGVGYTFGLKMLGNPLFTAPCRIEFGEGFPPFCRRTKKDIINFWIRKVTHTIDRSGYLMDVEVADAYTISGGVMVG